MIPKEHTKNKLLSSTFFLDKNPTYNKITVVKNNEIIYVPAKCAEIMNNVFSDSIMG